MRGWQSVEGTNDGVMTYEYSFGMGLARVLMLLLHLPSIREVIYLFRGPNRLEP